jgi:hypothetical protein
VRFFCQRLYILLIRSSCMRGTWLFRLASSVVMVDRVHEMGLPSSRVPWLDVGAVKLINFFERQTFRLRNAEEHINVSKHEHAEEDE